MEWLESTGKIIYDPHGRSPKAKHIVSEPWWVLLLCDQDIVNYYDYWLKKRGIYSYKYSLYGSHVSVVKGEKPPNMDLWKKHNRRKVKFRYSHEIHDNGKYWWLKVDCPELTELRVELGLDPRPPYFGFHLTVGRRDP